MKKRLFPCLLTVGMLLSLLAGCGETPASESSIADPVPPNEAPVSTPQQAPDLPSAAAPEDSQQESMQEAEAFVPSAPLSYPLADGSVTFTILHPEPQLGPMSGSMPMTTYGDFETIAAGTEYIGVTPEWQSLSQMTADTQFNLIIAAGDYPDGKILCRRIGKGV